MNESNLSIRVTDDLRQDLERLASQQRIRATLSETVRAALELGISILQQDTETSDKKLESDTLQEAYLDRNQAVQLVAILAKLVGYPVGMKRDDAWPIIYIQLPTGQVSWHLPLSQVRVAKIADDEFSWDGHSLDEKRQRIEQYLAEMVT